MKQFYVTGDKHGIITTYRDFQQDPNVAVIILGDAGFNFYLGKKDQKIKQYVSENSKCTWYVVRGNHEARPQDVPNMKEIYDEDVNGLVYVEDGFDKIRYFKDWGIYTIGGYSVAVIGGAYSVDKWYRLTNAGVTQKLDPKYLNPKVTGWFPNEQLSTEEMQQAEIDLAGKSFDFVLTHTCPISWEPTDVFMPVVDQSTVDKSMEIWLNELKSKIDWGIWLFGHYHRDRFERPHVEMFYYRYYTLDDIHARWLNYDQTGELGKDWLFPKSPLFYAKEQ